VTEGERVSTVGSLLASARAALRAEERDLHEGEWIFVAGLVLVGAAVVATPVRWLRDRNLEGAPLLAVGLLLGAWGAWDMYRALRRGSGFDRALLGSQRGDRPNLFYLAKGALLIALGVYMTL
jgi:hypothetical protein